jgi:RNA polymerase sigma factor (sigma-70 family)
VTPRRLIEPARLAGATLLRTQSDERLVDLVRAGHAAAFEAIVERYRKPLLAYSSRLLPPARAEDAVQQAFLSAYQAMVRDDAELRLRPWLYRITHNASLNLLRQKGWTHEQLDPSFDGVERPDQVFERGQELRSTLAAVKGLPERQRNAVLLRELEGRSYEEIALALGLGGGAVRQLLNRARATLRAGASALTPIGAVERLAAMAQGTVDPVTRAGEVGVGIGAGAGVAKLGAAVLATGAIATSAITGPLAPHSPRRSSGSEEASAVRSDDGGSSKLLRGEGPSSVPDDGHRQRGRSGRRDGPGGDAESHRRGSNDGSLDHHSNGGQDGSGDRGGTGERSSSSGGSSNSGETSGSGGLTEGGGSGGSGSDNTVTTAGNSIPLAGTTDGGGSAGSDSSGSSSSGGDPTELP